MKYEFTLQHNRTNSDEDQEWKDNILTVLKNDGLEKDFRGFFSSNDVLACYIVTSPLKYWRFVRKHNLKVCTINQGIRFLTGTMEVE